MFLYKLSKKHVYQSSEKQDQINLLDVRNNCFNATGDMSNDNTQQSENTSNKSS